MYACSQNIKNLAYIKGSGTTMYIAVPYGTHTRITNELTQRLEAVQNRATRFFFFFFFRRLLQNQQYSVTKREKWTGSPWKSEERQQEQPYSIKL